MRQIGGASTIRLLDVFKTLFSFSRYFLSNAFVHNIKYCGVAFSLLLSIYIIKCIVHIKYFCIN